MQFKEFLKRLFSYLKEHLGKLILSSFLMIVASAMESAVPELTGRIVDNLFTDNATRETAFIFSIGLFLIMFLGALFSIASFAGSTWVSNKVIMDIRVDMFSKLIQLPKTYFDNKASGDILSKLTYDVEQIAATASSVWLDLLKSFVTVLILLVYLFYKNWQLSLFLIVLFPLISLVVFITSSRMKKSSIEVQKTMGSINSSLTENINGGHIVKLYGAQDKERAKFFDLLKNLRQQKFKLEMTGAFNTDINKILISIVLSLVVYISSVHMNMTAGEFLAYFTALAMMVKPIKNLSGFNKPLQKALIAGESVFGLIDLPSENNNGIQEKSIIRGEIIFSKINFSYDKNKTVLTDFSLKIQPGETVAFVGMTGSGKSTVVDLLTRLYEPSSGQITIDGTDISDFDIFNLRSFIAYVDQSALLFNNSIKENIKLGQDKISDKQIVDAAKASLAYDFINNLDDKFDFEVGENGVRLSGGQRQRIALARAFAKNAPILILDEATSALDSKTEKDVQAFINKLSGNKTIILIAHRLSTVIFADKIVFINKGRITEVGKHFELLDKKGDYYNLFNSQFNSK